VGGLSRPTAGEKTLSYGTVINSIDGRVQIPVINFLLERFSVSYLDVITELAPHKILAEQADQGKISAIMQRLNISMLEHGSRQFAVVGHYDCPGNQASRTEQIEQLRQSVAFLQDSYPGIEIIGLWLPSQWRVEEVC
jgi:hypothetical protein